MKTKTTVVAELHCTCTQETDRIEVNRSKWDKGQAKEVCRKCGATRGQEYMTYTGQFATQNAKLVRKIVKVDKGMIPQSIARKYAET